VWQRIGCFAHSVGDLLALSQTSRSLRRLTLHLCIDESQKRRLCDRLLHDVRRLPPTSMASAFFGAKSPGRGEGPADAMDGDTFRLAKVLGHLLTGNAMSSVSECESAISGDLSRDHHASVIARLENLTECEAREPGSYLKADSKRLLARLLHRLDSANLSTLLMPIYRLMTAVLEVAPADGDIDDIAERRIAGAILRIPWAFPL
jgi:hypothetical protein